jgi:hypothetical protein
MLKPTQRKASTTTTTTTILTPTGPNSVVSQDGGLNSTLILCFSGTKGINADYTKSCQIAFTFEEGQGCQPILQEYFSEPLSSEIPPFRWTEWVLDWAAAWHHRQDVAYIHIPLGAI